MRWRCVEELQPLRTATLAQQKAHSQKMVVWTAVQTSVASAPTSNMMLDEHVFCERHWPIHYAGFGVCIILNIFLLRVALRNALLAVVEMSVRPLCRLSHSGHVKTEKISLICQIIRHDTSVKQWWFQAGAGAGGYSAPSFFVQPPPSFSTDYLQPPPHTRRSWARPPECILVKY